MPGVKGRSGGHNIKPTSDHLSDGTYRRHRHSQRAELSIPPATLDCPFEDGSEAFGAWKRIIETLPADRVTLLDFDALLIYCELWQLLREVWPKFRDNPFDKDTRITALALLDRLSVIGRTFGMSPLSRMSLRFPESDKVDGSDPLQQFFNRRKKT